MIKAKKKTFIQGEKKTKKKNQERKTSEKKRKKMFFPIDANSQFSSSA